MASLLDFRPDHEAATTPYVQPYAEAVPEVTDAFRETAGIVAAMDMVPLGTACEWDVVTASARTYVQDAYLANLLDGE